MKQALDSSTKRTGLQFGIAIVIVAFLAIVAMIKVSLTRGDDVPAGSSLKVAPEGTKLLYQSLASIPELTVERNMLTFSQVDFSPESVWLMLGCSGREDTLQPTFLFGMKDDDVEQLEDFVKSGGRLVVALYDSVSENRNREASMIAMPTLPKPGSGVVPTPTVGPGKPPIAGTPTPKAGSSKKRTTTAPPPKTGPGTTPTPGPAPT